MKFYYRKNGEVAFRSEGEVETKLPYFDYDPTLAEREQIEQNYHLIVEGKRLMLEKPPTVIAEEKKLRIENIKANVMAAKTISELRNNVLELIKLL